MYRMHAMPRLARLHVLNSKVDRKRSFRSFSVAADELYKATVDVDSTMDEMKPTPFKTLLEMPARAAWRVTPPHRHETPFEKARHSVRERANRLTNGHRRFSNKDLQRIYETVVMDAQRSLLGRRERERVRILRGREYKPREIKKDAAIGPILYGPEEALAAWNFRAPQNYAVAQRVLRETRSLVGNDWKPRRIIDFGIGCGSATAAALDVWKDAGRSGDNYQIEWIHGIDSSRTMREGAEFFLEKFCQEQDRRSTPRVTLSGHLSVEGASGSPPAFDLALFSYTAGEMTHTSGVLAAAASLWEKLRPGGLLVMIEPGTPDGFGSIRSVRNMLLSVAPPHDRDRDEEDGSSEADDECHILAPCTHNGDCPIERYQLLVDERRSTQTDVEPKDEPGDSIEDSDSDGEAEEISDGLRTGFCSFVQTLPGASSRSKGEKFSYIVAQKRIHGEYQEPSHAFEGDDLVQLLDHSTRPGAMEKALELENRFLNSDDDDLGLELVRGRTHSRFGRIVSAPKKRRGHIYIETCSAPGILRRQIITKSTSELAPGIYQAARKSRWGGYFPLTEIAKSYNSK